MATRMSDYGWQKIAEVSVHRDVDQSGRTEYEAVEILSSAGDWFLVGIRHADPSADELAESYRQRGWTDARCVLMGRRTTR